MRDFLKFLPKIREKIKNLQDKFFETKLICTIVFFVVLLIVFLVFDVVVEGYLKANKLSPVIFSDPKVSDYPILRYKENPDISALGAVVMDDASKVVLFSKNPNLRFSLASTAKLMTALVALEYYKTHDILIIQSDNVEGSVVGFKKRERLYFEDLLNALLLSSSNDAALAIAQNYKGGEEEFVKKMNEKAKELHLYNTHFSDSSGLDDGQNYTTAVDLANLASVVINNPVLLSIVSEKIKVISNLDNSNIYILKNLNKLLGVDGIDGIKTGYTEEAGGVLTTSLMYRNHRLIMVVMKSEDRFSDTLKLLFNLKGNLSYLATHR